MHVCCCWIQEGKGCKRQAKAATKLYSFNALIKKEKKMSLRTSGQYLLPTDFFFCWRTRGGQPLKWQGYVTQPTVNNRLRPKSLNVSASQAGSLKYTLHTVSAICRCCLLGQGSFLSLLWCPYLTSKWSHCRCNCTSRNWSFCCITVFLYMLFFFFLFHVCVPVKTEWLCMELNHTFDIL